MTSSRRSLPRIFRALLSLYPAGYRHQVGAEVVETYLDQLAEARRRGRGAAVSAVVRIIGDLLIGVPIEWGSLVQARLPRDLRVALRALGAHPGYSSVIVLTLALSIGANTAVFSLIDAVLLRPVPVANQAQLVAIYSASPRSPNDGVAYPTYKTLASGSTLLSGLAASMTRDASMDLGNRSETASVVVTSGNYFSVLGLRPQAGRLLEPSDEAAPLASPVAVLSDALWDRLYERRPSAMGSTLRLGDVTFTIVGVAPRGFHGTDLAIRQDVWVPVTMIQGLGFGGMFSGRFGATILTTFNRLGWLQLVGRMRPGAAPALVSAEIGALIASSATPGSPPLGQVRAVPLADAATTGSHDGIVTFTRLLGCVVGLMLVLACANVASLLGVRAAGREREIGVSVALGASRARIMGQLLLESALLAGAGGGLGVAVGRLFMMALSAFALPGGIDIDTLGLSLEPRVLAFALVLSVTTTMLCGLWPAARASRADPIAALRSQLRSGWTREPRGAMVALQVAIVIVIVAAAGLFVRSLRAGLATDLGFDPEGLAAASVELRLSGYTGSRAAAFYEEVASRLSARPGIERSAIASAVPLDPTPPFDVRPGADGVPVVPVGPDAAIKAVTFYVTPAYFETMRVPLIEGRDFSKGLGGTAADEVILNESAVRALWPDRRAIGRHVIDLTGHPGVVVGVVRDMKYSTLLEHDVPGAYYSASQQMVAGRMFVMARGSGDPSQTLATIRSVIADVDPHLPVGRSFPVREYVNRWMAPQRFGSALLSVFGVVALAVSGIGIYATLAWRVMLRRQEIGVRLALGAAGSDIVATILKRTGAAVGVGMIVGTLAALAVARTFQAFLFGVTWTDPVALAGTMALVACAVALVVAGPLRDALRTDPLVAMRTE